MKKLLALATVALISSPALAAPEVDSTYSSYLTVGAGYYDVFQNDFGSAVVSGKYMGKPFLWNVVRPVAAAFANADGAVYGGAGIAFDFSVADNWYVTPSVTIGAYSDGSDSKDLGGALEFRDGIEIGYKCDNGSRIGLELVHLSNAGIYDNNPGVEMLLLNYSWPLN